MRTYSEGFSIVDRRLSINHRPAAVGQHCSMFDLDSVPKVDCIDLPPGIDGHLGDRKGLVCQGG